MANDGADAAPSRDSGAATLTFARLRQPSSLSASIAVRESRPRHPKVKLTTGLTLGSSARGNRKHRYMDHPIEGIVMGDDG